MIRKKIKLFGVALDLFILDNFDETEVNSILLLLLSNNQLKSGDVVTFGKKGLRVNHEPKDIVDGYLVDRPTGYQKKGRRRGYNSIGVGQFHRKGCKYRIDKSFVILTTNGQNKVDFIIDVDDFNLVRKYSWVARKAKDHIAVFYRYRTPEGISKTLTLERALGIDKSCKHINGNCLDFRRDNIVQ